MTDFCINQNMEYVVCGPNSLRFPLDMGGKVYRVKLAESFSSSKLRYSPSQDALVLPESVHLGEKKNLEWPWVKVKVDNLKFQSFIRELC